MIELSKIYAAKEKVYDVAIKTPFNYSRFLSNDKYNIYLKCENLQTIGAYKIRGAYNKIASLNEEQKKLGVVAASAGNHAQGVAFSASKFGIAAHIVMPESTPVNKVSSTANLGANVILKGDNFDEAYAYAKELEKTKNLTFIHPFADPFVMAGQGTIFLELIEELNNISYIIVPVGGGGLISGIVSAAKQINPNIKVIGVQSKGASAMLNSFNEGKIINSNKVKTIADGIAVRDVNEDSFNIIKNNVDDMVMVSDEEIANAVLFLLEQHKQVVEGAGAASVAAVMHGKIPNLSGNVVCILSGGNIDITMLNNIIEKGLIKSYRKMQICVTLIDKAGALLDLTKALKDAQANIIKVDYDRLGTDFGDANITITLETKGKAHQEEVGKILKEQGFTFKEIK
ncbi:MULTISPECIES: threonine ammonia-lyase [unclassified Campylobacter]|uniref:threonine ammonia-lyase n=1 Tax=unclassified Campylobacter TaxID=2593542 RepID=UPI001BDA4AE9|nr:MULTISPECIES: threonine ammonia-lyase [unclassified Campylobacter]MBZ7977969.1 threonine ammonia-lyase [Campylobacter sp. RM12654]MBZ7981824.1 threonine ammonia-lyase [Campylobacter sp. RM12640]MBZ7988771.1 threonine ammonia-lyase [Campylobacter sp. RM12635]MBZ7990926.1 threonine ammonia-lyase [Campylobacter sp. RM9331]MBZ8005780.1 threonine ammonia-lyase [Campylobacter sp. RM9332]